MNEDAKMLERVKRVAESFRELHSSDPDLYEDIEDYIITSYKAVRDEAIFILTLNELDAISKRIRSLNEIARQNELVKEDD